MPDFVHRFGVVQTSVDHRELNRVAVLNVIERIGFEHNQISQFTHLE